MSSGEHNHLARLGASVAGAKARYRDRHPIAGGIAASVWGFNEPS